MAVDLKEVWSALAKPAAVAAAAVVAAAAALALAAMVGWRDVLRAEASLAPEIALGTWLVVMEARERLPAPLALQLLPPSALQTWSAAHPAVRAARP